MDLFSVSALCEEFGLRDVRFYMHDYIIVEISFLELYLFHFIMHLPGLTLVCKKETFVT